MIRSITILLVLLLIAACTSPRIIEGITTADKENSAVVFGKGDTFGDPFSILTAPITGSQSQFGSQIISIDGKKVSETGEGREWWIVPGKHILGVKCSHHLGSRIIEHGKGTLTVYLVKGHFYELNSIPYNRTCDSELVDISQNFK